MGHIACAIKIFHAFLMSVYGRDEIVMNNFSRKNFKGRGHLVYVDVDEGCVKMDLREIGCENVDWIHLAQDKNRWNLRVP
jgi:hypothetical protein